LDDLCKEELVALLEKMVLDPAVIRAELARGGDLGLGQVLRLRVRHFTDGVLLFEP